MLGDSCLVAEPVVFTGHMTEPQKPPFVSPSVAFGPSSPQTLSSPEFSLSLLFSDSFHRSVLCQTG